MSRPVKLTDRVRRELVAHLRGGVPVSTAARLAGVDPSTFYRWLRRGNSDLPADRQFREFRIAVTAAQAEASADLGRLILFAARGGSWQAAAYLLEVLFPANWGGSPSESRR